jgi:sortase family protein
MTRTEAGGRRVMGWVTLVAGLCTLAAGTATLVAPADPPDAGVVPAAVAEPDRPAPTNIKHPPAIRTAFAPAAVAIGALHVDAPVDPVGVTSDGALVIPQDPARLGWWIGSAMAGEKRGTVLLAGHVDTASDGPGALFQLEELPMGALIKLRADGETVTYRAVARRSYHKSRLPADLFTTDTAARLVLITCGGAFHHGSYTDNVVLYAVPTTNAPTTSAH